MRLPDPALIVLVGASGSGKSTWAAGRYRPQEVVSSDALRGVCTVVDTLGLVQIPQVGRAWEPIPEPYVTLGLLAGLDTGLRLAPLLA